MKKVFIINGSGGVGKDTFVEMVSKVVPTINYSSVDKVKLIAKQIGWDGVSKTDKDRKLLSDLKALTTEYNDMSFNCLKHTVSNFLTISGASCLFLHIREPEEIKRAVQEFNAETILVKRDSTQAIKTNISDANVDNYDYDYIINNSGTLEDLEIEARKFVYKYVCEEDTDNDE